jgi:protocatechuate 3,4-dioxygenase beta subunit
LNYSVSVSDANFTSQTKQVSLGNGKNTVNFSLASQSTVTLTGTVTDSGNIAPIQGATVSLTDANGAPIASTTTGTNGQYTFTGLQVGIYTFTASDTGFITQSTDVTLITGTNTDNISLQQAATMSGFVTDANGNAVQGATVTVAENGQTFTATTGTNGSYTISGLTPGTVNVTISASGFSPVATQATLTNGTNADNFALSAQQAELSGVVTDPNNTPVDGVTITATDSNGVVQGTTTTFNNNGIDGFYAFNNLPPGTYTISGTFTDNVTDTLLKGSVSGVVLGTGVTVNLQLQAF